VAESALEDGSKKASRKVTGDAAEARALAYLQAQGLRLVQRNYRVARGPRSRGGEIDLICRDRDGTLVFVEVRARRSMARGGAAASVGHAKRASLIFAAKYYLARLDTLPPCRFDVVALDGEALQWLPGAFDAE
jgi:putative endonuclease